MLRERVSFYGAWEKQTGIEEQEFVSMSQSKPEVGGGGKAMARGQKHLSFCSFISHGQLIPWVYASVSSKFE